MMSFIPLSAKEQEQLKENLGALPISGQAWPKWVKYVALLVMSLVLMQAGITVQKAGFEALNNAGGLFLLMVFIGLAFITYFMQHSVTTIDDEGIRQSWYTKRHVKFSEMSFAKFVPMLASKRLIVFVKKGRPVVFQAGTQDLQLAFAKISLQFKDRQY